MKPCSSSLLAAWTSLVLVSCSQEASTLSIETIETRLRAQEAAHQRLDQDLSRTLLVLAERLERVADTLGAVDPGARSMASPPPGRVETDARADRREPVLEEELLHAPSSPARELEMQRRTTIWLAAMVGGVIAVAAGLRLRSRAAASRATTRVAEGDEDDLDAGAWDEASVLTEAVTPRAEPGAEEHVEAQLDAEPVAQAQPIGAARADSPTAAVAAIEAAVVARPVVAAPRAADGLARCAFLIDALQPTAARSAIEAYLRHDPRVLQKPEPSVRAREGGVSVECAMLPGLPAGEKEHLRAILERLASTR